MNKVGNLFELAEKNLKQAVALGHRDNYTLNDIIDLAIIFRKGLDEGLPIEEIM